MPIYDLKCKKCGAIKKDVLCHEREKDIKKLKCEECECVGKFEVAFLSNTFVIRTGLRGVGI